MEDSSVTVNISPVVHHPTTPSQFEKLKEHMKLPSKKQVGTASIGGGITIAIALLIKLAQELGWLPF